MIKSYSLCATSHLYQIKCSINSFQPISFSKSLLNFNWNVVSCWLNPTTCDDDSDFHLNIKDDLTMMTMIMMTMVTMAMTMTPGVSSAPPECSPPPIPTFPPRPRCNSDHLGFDYDLYIMGAVCLCVCYVFSYFFFFTPPPPLCWENYFGRWIFFLKTFFFFLSNVSFRFFFKNLF